MTDRVEGERGESQVVRNKKRLTRWQIVGLIAIVTGVLITWVFADSGGERKRKPAEEQAGMGAIRQAVAITVPPIVLPQTPPTPQVPAPTLPLPVDGPPRIMQQKSSTPHLVSFKQEKRAAEGTEREKDTKTRVNFAGKSLPGGKAGPAIGLLYTLMPGPITCILDTAVDSTVDGPLMCHLDKSVTSPKGTVLMEKGTSVIGRYKGSSMQQGQDRVMSMAAVAYTPNGVPVPFDFEMADELGRVGLTGEVDTHFWARFGGALLLSLTDAGLNAATAAASQGHNNTYLNLNTSGMQNAATEALRNTINIPPTLRKNQGEVVTIFVTHPIDFSDSYELIQAGGR